MEAEAHASPWQKSETTEEWNSPPIRLDEARLAEWKKWQNHSVADVISAQEAARLVMEGAEEIGTQWIEVDRNEKVRVESEQAGEAKHVPMNLVSTSSSGQPGETGDA